MSDVRRIAIRFCGGEWASCISLRACTIFAVKFPSDVEKLFVFCLYIFTDYSCTGIRLFIMFASNTKHGGFRRCAWSNVWRSRDVGNTAIRNKGQKIACFVAAGALSSDLLTVIKAQWKNNNHHHMGCMKCYKIVYRWWRLVTLNIGTC